MIRMKIVAALHFIMLAIIPCLLFPSFVHCKCKRQPIIFSFGDSSDTGGLAAGLGYILSYPHGRTFFHKPSGRYCDGRIMLDFLCEFNKQPLFPPLIAFAQTIPLVYLLSY